MNKLNKNITEINIKNTDDSYSKISMHLYGFEILYETCFDKINEFLNEMKKELCCPEIMFNATGLYTNIKNDESVETAFANLITCANVIYFGHL